MADPETFPHSDRREARRRRRARARAIGLAVASTVMLVAIVGAGLIVTDVVRWPGAGDSRSAATHHPPTTTSSNTRPIRRANRRALTPTDPLRLWIAGDSLAGSIGPSLGQLTADTGVVQPQYDSRVSSGLLNPNFVNWPKRAREQLDLLDPEVVVFVIGTNDANVWSSNLADEYRIRTEAMMRELAGNGRELIWVGAPVAKSTSLEKGVIAVNLIAKDAARRLPGVTYVDAHKIFDDENGNYQQSFADHAGKRQVMRAGDGVHFSVAGADLIGQDVFAILDQRWHLLAQAVPDQPKTVRETKGSTQVPGTHRAVTTEAGSTPTTSTTRTSTASSSTSTSTSSTTSSPTTSSPTTTPTSSTSSTAVD
ncbi:MAG: DUF459 domain-containing protein [Acidimicrobiia bacterium]|nr:DUF459 domain-containing protein [Acidimicrobiia bacterium]